jgi:hypothetical protein
MNDDQIDALLGDLRTDVPEMSDDAFEAGRARLRVRASSEPVATTAGPDLTVVPLPKRRLLRSPPRRMVVPMVAAAAAVALAAGVLVVRTARHDQAAVPVESASVQLNVLADKIKPVLEAVPPDHYRYVVTRHWGARVGSTDEARRESDLRVLVETVYEEWVPADPRQQRCTAHITTTGNREWLEGTAELGQENGFNDLLPKPEVREFTRPCDQDSDKFWGAPTPELLASLPREPSQLNDRLRDDPGRTHVRHLGPNLTLFQNVAVLLAQGTLPADLRVALLRVLAMTPGLEVTEQVATLNGVKGTAFGVTEGGWRQEVVIDPATGEYVGERLTLMAGYQGPPVLEVVPGASTQRTIPAPTLKEDEVSGYSTTSRPVIVAKVGETS